MEFVKKLVKNGSSLAINVPCDVLETAGMKSGDAVKVKITPVNVESKISMVKVVIEDIISEGGFDLVKELVSDLSLE